MKASLLLALLFSTPLLHAESLIRWEKKVLETKFYGEGAAFGDINGDGKNDIVYGPFWFEGPDFTKRHTYYEAKEYSINGYSDNFFVYVRDFDGDGHSDILILGFPGKEARLYINPGKDVASATSWKMHIVANVVNNESPEFTDLTGDGKPEIVCGNGGQYGYYEPDWKDVTKPWTWHPVTDNVGVAKFTHGLGIGDVNGDGKMDLLEAKRWWEAPTVARASRPDSNPTKDQGRDALATAINWKPHTFQLMGGGAQMFAYDFNGDGRPDIVSSLAAHGYGVAWFENNSPQPPIPLTKEQLEALTKERGVDLLISPTVTVVNGQNRQTTVVRELRSPTEFQPPQYEAAWQKHLVIGQEAWENEYGIRFSQPHAMALADVDGDGIKDIITGKRYWAHNGHDPDERDPRVLYWFQTKRIKTGNETKVEFIPHMIDSDTGVGTQLVTGDIDGDGLLDVVVGNKYGCRVLLQRREEVNAERYAQFQPKKIYGPDRVLPKDYKAGQKAEDAVKGMVLPPGFKAELIAAEPDIVQPIAMCWDERGRLWVAEGNSYPQKRQPVARASSPGSKDQQGQDAPATAMLGGPDRILIFEDTKGTGKFDKRTVFLEGLNLVSGMEVGFGGVWIGAAPHLLFIPKDATDKPGEPKVLLDGWGMQDTHETLNSFIWGPDGWLYGCHGVFTHSKIGKPGTPEAERTPMNAGVWRYHPVRHEFEVFAHGTSNPWGLDYDEHGEFFITACVIPHLYHIVPGGRYQRQGGQHFNPHTYDDIKTIADHAHFAGNIADNAHWGARHSQVNVPVAGDTDEAGGGHAHCGLVIYQGDNFPAEYRGQLIFGNLHGHRLVSDHVEPNGSSFTGQHRPDFMRSNDHWFIPIQQKVGPDGALYVSDWSDKQVCHQGSNAVDMWDRSNGRIYRISYDAANTRSGDWQSPSKPDRDSGKNAASKSAASAEVASTAIANRRSLSPRAPFDLNKLSDMELAKMAVESENVWFERMARKVLMERMFVDATLWRRMDEAFYDLLKSSRTSAKGLSSLWLQYTIGGFSPDNLQELTTYNDAEIRAWAVRFFGFPYEAFVGERLPVPKNYKPTATWVFMDLEQKHFFALNQLAREDKSPIVRRELASLLQRLPLDKRADIAGALLQHKEDENDRNIPLLVWYGIEPVVAADAKAGLMLANACKWDKITSFIYRRMSSDDAGRNALLGLTADLPDAAQREKTLTMLVESARNTGRHEMPNDWPAVSAKLHAGATPAMAALVDEMSAIFGDETVIKKYRDNLARNRKPQSALSVLLQVRDLPTAKILQEIIYKEKEATPLRRKAIQSLVSLPDSENAGTLVNAYSRFSADEKTDAVSTLASTLDGATALLQGVGAKKIEPQMLSPFLIRQLQALKNANVDALITKVWGTVNQARPDIAQQKAKWRGILTPEKLKAADLEKGHEIYKSTCASCHRLLDEGVNVGPDITGSNRANLDYLLDNVLDPSAVIGKGYELNVFTMKDARVMSGIMKEESSTGYKLSMPGGVELVLNKTEITKRDVLKMSMMPEGQFDALGPEIVANLVAYLQKDAPAAKMPADSLKTGLQRVEGALEGEALKILELKGGVTKVQGGFGNIWSGGQQLWWTGGKPGSVLAFALPVGKAGKYSLKAVLTKARDYGMIEALLDGKIIESSKLDFYAEPGVQITGDLDWGRHDLTAGEHRLELKITGANERAAKGYMVGLDYVKLDVAK